MGKMEAVLQTGAVHFMGNGRLGVAASGLGLLEVFGPPYSSAPLVSLEPADEEMSHIASRVPGSAVWNHTLLQNGEKIGEMCEFVDKKLPCYVRHFCLREKVSFVIKIEADAEQLENGTAYGLKKEDGLLLQHEAGIFVYGQYPSPVPLGYQLLVTGAAELVQLDSAHYRLNGYPGESMFLVIGGKDMPELVTAAEEILKTPYDEIKNRTVAYWQEYQEEGYSPEVLIPEGTSRREELLEIFDSVSVLMKAQQGESGGVICGSVFHWAALRDQYGVSRSFLAQGHLKEAKAILQYYWEIWKKRGVLHNGQDIGLDGFFHIHENDEVEITGYLVIQAFDYQKASGDTEFLREIFPMLLWAYEVQKKNLWKDMLPFNGDETYIAGEVLPRSVLNDGSAEATMLFWTGGVRLVEFAEKENLRDSEWARDNKALLEKVKANYRSNFVKDNRLITNNPKRKEGLVLPRFRHGVCEACWNPPQYAFGWLERNENDRYVCPSCKIKTPLEKAPDRVYVIQSVSLQPFFVGTSLLEKKEVAEMIEDIVRFYQKTGRLPSRPDGNLTVGYDYGLLLYNLTELDHPLAEEIYEKMISLIDERGAWSEYYENDEPVHTRCRPWESGINLLAALKFAGTKYRAEKI